MGLRFRFWSALLALSLILGYGCAPEKIPPPPTPEQQLARLQDRAEAAWTSRRYEASEDLYLRMLEQDGLDREAKMQAWERAAASALRTGKVNRAREHLQAWAREIQKARQTWAWMRIDALSLEDPDSIESRLVSIMESPDHPWQVRREAGWFLTRRFLDRDRPSRAWEAQEKIYGLAESREQKFALEDELLRLMSTFEQSEWSRIEPSLADTDPGQYPYALLKWELAVKRFLFGRASWPNTWQELAMILGSAELADLERLKMELAFLEEYYQRPFFGVALLLPLSGGYQDIGWKVLRGAEVAQYQLTRLGLNIQVRTINTDVDGWLDQLRSLPSGFSLVGGPLRSRIWETVVQNHLQERKTFFAFRSTLAPAEEGIDGYRFFPSHEDQVRPLIQAAMGELGIDRFGVLYPKGAYGRRMASAFWKETVHHQGRLTGLAGYRQDEPSDWKQDVADFLRVPEEFFQERDDTGQDANATRVNREDPDFGAVFIPDSFHHAQILIPEFHFFDEDRLVFLGPALWSQQAKKVSKLDRQFYKLALMPGAWWAESPDPAMDNLKNLLQDTVQGEPDFWVSLGFDFLRFAHRVFSQDAVQKGRSLNQRLAALQDFSWSMAPLEWDEYGQASQDLYLFELQGGRMIRADVKSMKGLLERRLKLHEQRHGAAREEQQPAGSPDSTE